MAVFVSHSLVVNARMSEERLSEAHKYGGEKITSPSNLRLSISKHFKVMNAPTTKKPSNPLNDGFKGECIDSDQVLDCLEILGRDQIHRFISQWSTGLVMIM